ncbi:MAG TPA: DUF6644 family protein [Caulobacteraceae bacterium]|nr:DUF6644 family protein [Caulobacteraceae bacterium]
MSVLDRLTPFVTWLAHTRVSQGIGDIAWITPLVQSVHILAIAVVMSGVLMLDLRLLSVVGREQTTAQFAGRYLPWVWWSLLVLLATGATLIVGEPRRSLENPVFVLKMSLLLIASALTLTVQLPLRRDDRFWETPGRRAAACAIALVSLAVWACIVFAGRWIAYAQG